MRLLRSAGTPARCKSGIQSEVSEHHADAGAGDAPAPSPGAQIRRQGVSGRGGSPGQEAAGRLGVEEQGPRVGTWRRAHQRRRTRSRAPRCARSAAAGSCRRRLLSTPRRPPGEAPRPQIQSHAPAHRHGPPQSKRVPGKSDPWTAQITLSLHAPVLRQVRGGSCTPGRPWPSRRGAPAGQSR